MKLPSRVKTGVQSLGRQDISAPARMADAANSTNRAMGDFGQKLQGFAKDMEMAERKADMATATADLLMSDTNWAREHDGKLQYNNAELDEGILDGDVDEKGVTPAYKVRPKLYEAHTRKQLEEVSKRINNPKARAAWVEDMTVKTEAKIAERYLTAQKEQQTFDSARLTAKAQESVDNGNYNSAKVLIQTSQELGYMKAEDAKIANDKIDSRQFEDRYNNALSRDDVDTLEKQLSGLQVKDDDYSGPFQEGERRQWKEKLKGAISTLKTKSGKIKLADQTRKASLDILSKTNTKTEALSAVDKIKNAELAESVRKDIKMRITENETVQNQLKLEGSNTFMESIADGSETNPDLAPDPYTKRSAENYLAAKAAGQTIQSDMRTVSNLRQMSLHDPEKFMKTNLVSYRGNLSNDDFKSISQHQSMMKQNGFDTPALSRAKSLDGSIKGTMSTLDIDVKELTQTGDKGDEARKLYSAIELRIEEAEQIKGKKLTTGELTKELQAFEISHKIMTTERDQNFKMPWLSDEPDAENYILPDHHHLVPALVRELQRTGNPVNDDTIIALYDKGVRTGQIPNIRAE